MGTDPSKKQYFIFALILSLLFSFSLNFFLPDLVQASSSLGFPFSTADVSGFQRFFIQFVNSITMSALLTVPMYYFISWLQNRAK